MAVQTSLPPLIKLNLDGQKVTTAEIFEWDADQSSRKLPMKQTRTVDVSRSPTLMDSLQTLMSILNSNAAVIASYPFYSNPKVSQHIELLEVNFRQIAALTPLNDLLRGCSSFELVPCGEGETGTMFVQLNGKPVAVFKPITNEDDSNDEGNDQTLFLPTGLEASDAPVREVAAYILDTDGFLNVPATSLARITHPTIGTRVGAIQVFIANEGAHGTWVLPRFLWMMCISWPFLI